ncbi:Fe(3+)-hydroxamate ABC transporter substrate-binding protein FhuD [Cronobacter muytjensii]|uniref:Fe(3+)-hydroxamate ABC transporter substrate-binding protein FhuD n=1 Tax=Cronobacter muytjensii TaxID=413501 RepID=UPI0029D795A3|nr:Fe(3+)-hydroxamate ABC transporter substrate-binding protein FhuD [Cronobacter muytjensii]EKS1844777.1 Fe(3+)-hydroxamate ABC transporter substrate-binding protein FhuD [Cronobacter muytjensii]ELY2496968.1 Fe(3+)-hydroxamate ABC transporter substrate-binding protein FhuD [Cronobacter muytjensii]ELY3984670.1 Fe(3+)-hydroxamate ABC transporter substrate-binding protein FhuD [Cronobacter muytjensii]ELY6274404.1 Fe(3+)-hydroxamate ABC transporter substrate-binding protein FhuD [Cronobacter muytj
MRNVLSTPLSRRRLMTAMALSPLMWQMAKARAATVDLKRIVALEWLPVEQLLALGVTPYAVADVPNYRLWVNDPPLPDSVIDVGLRTEPNLELLTQLEPSLMIWSSGYGPAEVQLKRIAPGMGVTFTDGKAPLAMARQSLLTLAERLGLQAGAKAHLDAFDQFLTRMKPRFAARGKRPLLMMSLLDARHALTIGTNSLFQPVLDAVNVPNAWQDDTNFWGSAIVGVERLAQFKDADVICFEHGDDQAMQQLAATPLWQAMPFVRAGRFQRVPAVWFYGATLSAMRFGRVLDNALGGRV